MVLITDIYYKIDSNIVSQYFWGISIEEKNGLWTNLKARDKLVMRLLENER